MRPRTSLRRRLAVLTVATVSVAAALTGCTTFSGTVPGCGDPLRLAIIAQSVPAASYVPCLNDLPQGWDASGFDPARGRTSFLLGSDRSPERPVTVELTATCWTGGAAPSPARAPGVLTYTRLYSVQPRFAGQLYDVFPGGCVTYTFDFVTGSQIALMEQFESAVRLYPRQQLRLVLKQQLGIELSP